MVAAVLYIFFIQFPYYICRGQLPGAKANSPHPAPRSMGSPRTRAMREKFSNVEGIFWESTTVAHCVHKSHRSCSIIFKVCEVGCRCSMLTMGPMWDCDLSGLGDTESPLATFSTPEPFPEPGGDPEALPSQIESLQFSLCYFCTTFASMRGKTSHQRSLHPEKNQSRPP
jgi:hypothetical protein